MSNVRIVNLTDPTDVHVIESDYPKGSGLYEKMLDGIYRRVDFDRYAVEEEDSDG